MDLENRDEVIFTIGDQVGDSSVTVVSFFDSGTTEALGSITINKNKAQAFTNALDQLFRETYGVFENNKTHTTKLSNKTGGTILFREKS